MTTETLNIDKHITYYVDLETEQLENLLTTSKEMLPGVHAERSKEILQRQINTVTAILAVRKHPQVQNTGEKLPRKWWVCWDCGISVLDPVELLGYDCKPPRLRAK